MARTTRFILVAVPMALILIITLSLDMVFKMRAPQKSLLKITQVKDIHPVDDRLELGVGHGCKGTKSQSAKVGHVGLNITTGLSTTTTRTQIPLNNLATSSATAVSTPKTSPASGLPILALSYAGSAGPKHCRGSLIQNLSLPRPIDQWKNGTCINLPTAAQCGVFYADKQDHCEARLFNVHGCFDSTETYVNTVVFMPEERAVGSSLWRSMFVRCGVEVVDFQSLDPAVLGAALKMNSG